MAQVVGEDSILANDLELYLKKIGVTKAGIDYHIISIIGAQSSGKSTLLNHLFGTKFETMDETTGRQQTTKGIHASFMNKTLIFDIEGSDSQERGDADDLFERKAALFGLALSEVVIVNTWHNDIGRYNASSIPLLKTVFEVNLQLFATSGGAKCHLLFVIRDSTQDPKIIENQLRRDMELIWSQVVVPPHLKGHYFDDFFIFHFFPLPHYRLMRDEFDAAAKELNRHFCDTTYDKYLFKVPTGKVIPGDGLCDYITNVWTSINDNKELNLPSQRRTLANFRCEDYAKESVAYFTKTVERGVRKLQRVSEFGKFARKTIDETLEMYNEKACRYDRDIAKEKRALIVEKMGQILYPHFVDWCKGIRDHKKSSFMKLLDTEVDFSTNTTNWEKMMIEAKDRAVETMEKGIKRSRMKEFPWRFDISDVESSLSKSISQAVSKHAAALEEAVYASRKADYVKRVDEILKDANPNMWHTLRTAMRSESEQIIAIIRQHLQVNTINRVPSTGITERVARLTAGRAMKAPVFVQSKMWERFEAVFMLDGKGKVRNWTNETEDVAELFDIGRTQALSVLHMFSHCQLRESHEKIPPKDVLTQQIISVKDQEMWEQKFIDEIEKRYIDAVRVRESTKVAVNIPPLMWIGYMIFGYDKFVCAVRHPTISLFLLCIAAGIWYLYKQGRLDDVIQRAKEFGESVMVKIASDAVAEKKSPKKRKRNHK